jgi:hypothetical protein
VLVRHGYPLHATDGSSLPFIEDHVHGSSARAEARWTRKQVLDLFIHDFNEAHLYLVLEPSSPVAEALVFHNVIEVIGHEINDAWLALASFEGMSLATPSRTENKDAHIYSFSQSPKIRWELDSYPSFQLTV